MRKILRAMLNIVSAVSYYTGLSVLAWRFVSLLIRLTRYEAVYHNNIRPSWLMAGALGDRNVNKPLFFSAADASDDHRIVGRIIAAFCANTSSDKNSVADSGIAPVWTNALSRRWKPLLTALWARNEAQVFGLLSGMFRSDFIWGLASNGSEVDRRPHNRPLIAMGAMEQLVEMGEALSVARSETPEQGLPYYELRDGGAQLIAALERDLKIELGFPPVSSAYGVDVGGRLVVAGQFTHIYAAWRIREYMDRYLPAGRKLKIVEIGGGYGALCYWLHKLCGPRIESYSIVDLPSTGVIQAYFLTRALGSGEAVALYDSGSRAFDNGGAIRLIPHTEVAAAGSAIDIVINQDSFPELPESEVDRYLAWMSQNAQIFVSLNQEAYSPVSHVPQVWVAERCSRVAALTRIVREKSWVRFGYVDEVYKVTRAES